MANNFMTISPRSDEYLGYNVEGIPLKILKDEGIEYSPHISFSSSDLQNGAKYFHNNTGKCDSFSISVILNENDVVQGRLETDNPMEWVRQGNIMAYKGGGKTISFKRFSIIEMLDYFIRKGELFYVTTEAVGINETDLWLITANKSRNQYYNEGIVIWDLTFTKYVKFTYASFENDNSGATKALQKYEKKKEANKKKAQKKAEAKKKTTAKYKLQHDCKYNQLKYSKSKKVVTCVKYMQRILYNKKFLKNKADIDGWYGKTTKNAVKSFQNKYHKKYNLKQDGNVDKATFKALYSV